MDANDHVFQISDAMISFNWQNTLHYQTKT